MDKLYACLKDLAEERNGRLQERLRLTQLKREVDDLEQWIAEREVVAGSHELGQDYDHVTVSCWFFFFTTLFNSVLKCFSFYTTTFFFFFKQHHRGSSSTAYDHCNCQVNKVCCPEMTAQLNQLMMIYVYIFPLKVLRDKFREFARDTSNIGQERVDGVNALADDLIESGHPENANVAEWKDGLNEAWADLLELIDTRTQMLAASYELHRFHQDAMEVLERVQQKQAELPSDLGRDLSTVQHLHRQHNTFEHDIQALSGQVSSMLKRSFLRLVLEMKPSL